MWWPFGIDHATLGMIIVAPDLQGRGLGRRLMEAALTEVGSRHILLNATKEGLPLYEKLDFREIGVIAQHQGVPGLPEGGESELDPAIRGLCHDDLSALISLDAAACGFSRDNMLQAIFEAGEGLVLERNGRPQGYALFRPFGRGHVIGPVVADEGRTAQALINAWIENRRGDFLRTDLLLSDVLSDWVASRGLPKVDEVSTMLRGEVPVRSSPSPRQFSLASQALG